MPQSSSLLFCVDTYDYNKSSDLIKHAVDSEYPQSERSVAIVVDPQGCIASLSHSPCPVTGYLSEELIGKKMGAFFPPHFDEGYLRNIHAYFLIADSTNSSFTEPVVLPSKSGGEVYVSADLLPISDNEGCLAHYLVSIEKRVGAGVTEDDRELDATYASTNLTRRLEKALQFAGINLFKIDAETGEGAFIYSASGQKTFLKPELWLPLVEPEYRELVEKSHDRPGAAIEYAYRPNGPAMPVRWLSQAIIDQYTLPDGRIEKLGFSRDITKERRYAEQLKSLDARSGGITSEALRAVFADLVADHPLDRFSFYAIDLLAHDSILCEREGISETEVLQALFLRMFQFLETQGSIAGSPLTRSGLLVLVNHEVNERFTLLLSTLCDSPLQVKNQSISFSVRCVRCDYPTDAVGYDSILLSLRRTLSLAAKENKPFRRYQHTDFEDEKLSGTEFIGDIDDAFRRGEFRLFLQPKVDARPPYRIIGAEALLRWQHPHEGLLAPDRFLELLVNTHWRPKIAKWVIHEAVSMLTQIREVDPRQKLAFNLTAYDLCDLDILGELLRMQEQSTFPAESLTIELSESQTQISPQALHRSIRAVKALGFSLALDDFGQEMSSLSYLVNLPLDEIKVDKVFLDESMDTEATDKVIAFVTDFARIKGWSTVVEGVESQAQALRVQALGIDEAQGYFFGKAVPLVEFIALIQQQQPLSD